MKKWSAELIRYLASVIILVSPNPYVDPILRTKVSFSSLPTCIEKLLLTPNITTFLTHSPSDHENC